MEKKEILEQAKQAGYNNDSQLLAKLFLEKTWIAGETNIQKAFIKGQRQREKENKNLKKK